MGAAGIGKVLWMRIAGSGKSQAGADCLDLVGREEPDCQRGGSFATSPRSGGFCPASGISIPNRVVNDPGACCILFG